MSKHNPPIMSTEFYDADGVPSVRVVRAGITEHWVYAQETPFNAALAWTFTMEKNDVEAGTVYAVAGDVPPQTRPARAGRDAPRSVQGEKRPGAQEPGEGADSLAAVFERLLRYANSEAYKSLLLAASVNRHYGKMSRDPRAEAARVLAQLTALAPVVPCPCLACSIDRAFDRAGEGLARAGEDLASAAIFIELGGIADKQEDQE